ncbi:MAG: TolC family protein [Pontibacterium sp.]
MNKQVFKLAPLSLAIVLAGCSVVPKPLTDSEIDTRMRSDRQIMFAEKPANVTGLTLNNAIDMAMQNNFELRQKMMEEAIASQQLDLAHYDMLPELVAAAGYTARSNQNSSRSVAADGSASSQSSTSQDRNITTSSLSTAWNVLDFGVSYYQAQQTADQTLIAEQRRRKIVHNLVQQVRTMYWNAVGAQHLQGQVTPLLENARLALANAEQVGAEKLINPLETLRYRKDLLEIIRQLEGLRDELARARPELAILLGLSPGAEITLAIPEQFELLKPELNYSLEEMEDIALGSRPELIEANYQRRITALDTRKALARLLPGLELSFGQYYDSNSFLENSSWTQGGIRVSWNLFNLLRGRSDVELAEAREELADSQRMALNMAVMSQVHVSWLEYQSLSREFERASELAEIGGQIHARIKDRQTSSVQSRMEEIKSATSALTEELRMFRSYAGLQEAYGRMQATLGMDEINQETGGFGSLKTVAQMNSNDRIPVMDDTEESTTAEIRSQAATDKPVATSTSESAFDAVTRWASAWESKDIALYLAQYSDDFPGGGARARQLWQTERTQRLSQPGFISLSLGNMTVSESGSEMTTIEFDQRYKSNLYADRIHKTLRLQLQQGVWKIIAEKTRDL